MRHLSTYLPSLLSVLSLVGVLTGCIKEDFSGCPPKGPEGENGRLFLELSYTMHNRTEKAGYVDRLGQEVQEVDVFVFDQDERFLRQERHRVTPTADGSPFRVAMDLPEGGYRFVVWGEHDERETRHNLTRGMPLDEGLMALRATEMGYTELLNDSLFHGISDSLTLLRRGEERIVPVDLMKDRKDVRLLVRWHEKGTPKDTYCSHVSHFEELSARIVGRNAVYDFYNELPEQASMIYLGGDFPDPARYDSTFHFGALRPAAETTWIQDFAVGRLMKGSRARLQLLRGDSLVYERQLMEVIDRIEAYATQEALDREDHFLIELLLECEHKGEGGGEDPDNPDNPDNPDVPVNPVDPPLPAEKQEVSIGITINGWTFIDRDIHL